MPSLTRKERIVTADDVRALLLLILERVLDLGGVEIAIKAGNVHRRLGGYPARDHCMPCVCAVMREMMGPDDEVLAEPSRGYGAKLVIRYKLSRKRLLPRRGTSGIDTLRRFH